MNKLIFFKINLNVVKIFDFEKKNENDMCIPEYQIRILHMNISK